MCMNTLTDMNLHKLEFKSKTFSSQMDRNHTISFRILVDEPHKMIGGGQVQITKIILNLGNTL